MRRIRDDPLTAQEVQGKIPAGGTLSCNQIGRVPHPGAQQGPALNTDNRGGGMRAPSLQGNEKLSLKDPSSSMAYRGEVGGISVRKHWWGKI